jgi:hypothetical protein
VINIGEWDCKVGDGPRSGSGRGTSGLASYVKRFKQSPLSPVKHFKQKYILKYYLHGFERERRKKIQQRLCYIKAAKFVIPGRLCLWQRKEREEIDRFLPQIPIIETANCLLCRCIFMFSSFLWKGFVHHTRWIFFKGTASRYFLLLVFSWINFPPAPECPCRAVSNFFANLRRYSQVKVTTGSNASVVDTSGKYWDQYQAAEPLKVPKREIFDRSDIPDFYTIKSLRVGDFGVKIKKNLQNI